MAAASLVFSHSITAPPSIADRGGLPEFPSERTSDNVNLRISGLKSCKNIHEIKQLHCQFTKSGLLDDLCLLSELVTEYSKLGSSESLQHAKEIFSLFKNTSEDCGFSVVSLYNSLIRGSSSAGEFREAILLYLEMLFEGVQPDKYTFPFLLSACGKCWGLVDGAQLHCSAVKRGLHGDVFVLNSFILYYGECGEIDKARKVFDEMPETNVVSWTSMICAYSRRDRHKEAVSLFLEMVEDGIEPNEVTVVSVVSACANLGDLSLGERVLSYVSRSKMDTNPIMVNAVVNMYMKCGAADKANKLFDECSERNLVLCNTMMSNYVKMGNVKEALDIFREMINSGPKPDRVTFLAAITSSAKMGDVRLGMQFHARVLRNGFHSCESIANSLIDMYSKSSRQELACRVFDQMPIKATVSWNSLLSGLARNGDLESAREVFAQMPQKSIVSWNTMISALVHHSFFSEALELFQRMQREGIIANESTMVNVASACGYLGALDLGKWIYRYIEKENIHCNTRLSTALMDMFAKCGEPQIAMKVFGTMKERDISAWTTAIGAMAKAGNGERALNLFNEMLAQGFTPDAVVFSGALTACSHSGLVEQGMALFESMKNYGITPEIIHYGCIVDLLGRAGLLEQALEFINVMPIEPNAATWSAYLAACRMHKNEKMATLAAEMIRKSADKEAGVQVLLSNIYAYAGKWDDVAEVRTQMKHKGIKKLPGSSSIELKGAVHEFTSGDESHTENTLTTLMLQEINCRLRKAGYIPDSNSVLLHVDEEEKLFLISRHSEKLAIAFGLVSSCKGVPIRVVKNLRICSDCHAFAKMVSKEYDREIVIRDNNRFHFFRQGSCSCHDYW